MKEIHGDLIALAKEGHFDVIIHGCNCQCAMGAGIAKTIKEVFPQAYEADLKTPASDRSKLGSYSYCQVTSENHPLTIVNAYTQFHWRGKGLKVDYEAIRSVMKKIKCNFSGKRIAYPLIGAGLAGGDWNIIKNIIDQELLDEDHTLVIFEK
ncbi:macro domain-containing protein [Pleionea sp. CnH1-48]|uniref:macro domain-containing protein n=1 Tax=Pleionea sp. CnH1-48 TaxID=2954494 RepID=UPI0020971FE7|nr:macro domain-containing protein [Pleionea sp. CnH1-48]MCO7226734.1 macro domain-containing protein [Pleionea sp. CnH1-48]